MTNQERLTVALRHVADGIAVARDNRERGFWSADQHEVFINGLENTARETLMIVEVLDE